MDSGLHYGPDGKLFIIYETCKLCDQHHVSLKNGMGMATTYMQVWNHTDECVDIVCKGQCWNDYQLINKINELVE